MARDAHGFLPKSIPKTTISIGPLLRSCRHAVVLTDRTGRHIAKDLPLLANLTPLWLLKYLPNMLACHVTIIHDLRGPSNTATTAGASSHHSVAEAVSQIARGDADAAIAGGAESKVNPPGLLRQSLLARPGPGEVAHGAEQQRPEPPPRPKVLDSPLYNKSISPVYR